ncbi:MAG: cytochrome P450 [Phototrophicaceae bacterium]
MVADVHNPYNLFDPQSHRNPQLYDLMRETDPIHAAINPETGQTHWFLTRYDDCVAFLRDKRFGKQFRQKLPIHITEKWAISHSETLMNQNMLTLDDPTHARLKALVLVAFSPQKIAQLRPILQHIADGLFDVIDANVSDGAEFDLTDSYIAQLPLLTIAAMLGIPTSDFEQLFMWTQAMLDSEEVVVRDAIVAFSAYLDKEIDARQQRVHKTDDILTALIFAEYAGERLNRAELHAMIFLLITAGFETMVNFISNSIVTLFDFPEQMAYLQQHIHDDSIVKSSIEELLRFSGPSHMTLTSWAYEAVTMRDKVIQQGDCVHAVLFAANRDPLIFPNPNHFDILRQENDHIAFSYGIHHCLGAMLARIEGEIALLTLLRRMPNL